MKDRIIIILLKAINDINKRNLQHDGLLTGGAKYMNKNTCNSFYT